MKTLVVLLLLTAACLSAAEVQTPEAAKTQIVTVITARMPTVLIVGRAEKVPVAAPSVLAFHGPAGPPPICPADGPEVCGGGPISCWECTLDPICWMICLFLL